jgi:hypothetical protein
VRESDSGEQRIPIILLIAAVLQLVACMQASIFSNRTDTGFFKKNAANTVFTINKRQDFDRKHAWCKFCRITANGPGVP